MDDSRIKGIKNIEEQIGLIKIDVKDCDNQTPNYAVNTMEYIDLSIRDGIITQEDGVDLKSKLRKTLDGFKHCRCMATPKS